VSGFRLPEIDRRLVFAIVAAVVVFPIFFRLSLPEVPSTIVMNVFDSVESLPAGAMVLMPMDFDPGSEAELQPMARAFVRHCAEKKLRITFLTLWGTGSQMIERVTKDVLIPEFPDYQYGRDWVNLGYKPGMESVITVILNDLKKTFPTDVSGKNLDDIPLTRDVRNLRNYNLILSVSAGYAGTKEWVQFAGDPGQIPVAAGMTAVQAPLNYPYYPRQLKGLLGGVKAAAEYESLLIKKYPRYEDQQKYRFEALTRMGPQTFAHLAVIGLILLGNATYWINRRAAQGGA